LILASLFVLHDVQRWCQSILTIHPFSFYYFFYIAAVNKYVD